MGHNVEQTFSLRQVDYTLLEGVPNTAFTEALAFVFQARDLELLGLPAPDAQSEAMRVLNDFWATYEIAGVALVDMAVWHWMYDHPEATPKQLNDAAVQISKDMWNRYYAPVFHKNDVVAGDPSRYTQCRCALGGRGSSRGQRIGFQPKTRRHSSI